MIILQGGKLRAVMGGSGGPLIVSAVYQTLVCFPGALAVVRTFSSPLGVLRQCTLPVAHWQQDLLVLAAAQVRLLATGLPRGSELP